MVVHLLNKGLLSAQRNGCDFSQDPYINFSILQLERAREINLKKKKQQEEKEKEEMRQKQEEKEEQSKERKILVEQQRARRSLRLAEGNLLRKPICIIMRYL